MRFIEWTSNNLTILLACITALLFRLLPKILIWEQVWTEKPNKRALHYRHLVVVIVRKQEKILKQQSMRWYLNAVDLLIWSESHKSQLFDLTSSAQNIRISWRCFKGMCITSLRLESRVKLTWKCVNTALQNGCSNFRSEIIL